MEKSFETRARTKGKVRIRIGRNRDLPKIRGYVCDLLARHTALDRFANKLSKDDLVQAITAVHANLSRGFLVDPPIDFVSSAQQLVPREDRRSLERALEAWHAVFATDDLPLQATVLEFWALRLLWETSLINEYERRMRRNELSIGNRKTKIESVKYGPTC